MYLFSQVLYDLDVLVHCYSKDDTERDVIVPRLSQEVAKGIKDGALPMTVQVSGVDMRTQETVGVDAVVKRI